MSDMQKESEEKAEQKESEWSVGPPTQTLEKVAKTGVECKLVSQDKEKVVFQIYCKDQSRTWYGIRATLQKEEFKRL